jgi:hypothetical protein
MVLQLRWQPHNSYSGGYEYLHGDGRKWHINFQRIGGGDLQQRQLIPFHSQAAGWDDLPAGGFVLCVRG